MLLRKLGAIALLWVLQVTSLRPDRFPPLPPFQSSSRSSISHWHVHIIEAYERVEAAYNHGSNLLRLEEAEPLRLQASRNALLYRTLPLMERMEQEMVQERVWLRQSAAHVSELLDSLDTAITEARSRYFMPLRLGSPFL